MFDGGVTTSAVTGCYSRVNSTAVDITVPHTVNSHSIVAATPHTSGAVNKGVTVAHGGTSIIHAASEHCIVYTCTDACQVIWLDIIANVFLYAPLILK